MPNTKSKQSKQEQNNLRENTEKSTKLKDHYKKENLYLQQYPASDSLGPSVQQPIELYMA